METYISILRGINVLGHNIIKMDALRAMYFKMGFRDAHTYIQSGNVIFRAQETDTVELATKIAGQVKIEFGNEVPVIVMTQETLRQIISGNPFAKDTGKEPNFLHVTFLAVRPTNPDHGSIEERRQGREEVAFSDHAVYLYCPNGYGSTKLSNSLIEAKMKVGATTRNWKTTLKLLEMAESGERRA